MRRRNGIWTMKKNGAQPHRKMSVPFIVMSAPNGARRGKDDHKSLPITPAELADCAESIADAGASIIHLHVRDEQGGHSLDTDRYRAASSAVRDRVGDHLIIQVTTEACGLYSAGQQMAMVRELKPEAVSLALKELCPDAESESTAAEFFAWLKTEDVMPQYILFGPDDVIRFSELRNRGVIPHGTSCPARCTVRNLHVTSLIRKTCRVLSKTPVRLHHRWYRGIPVAPTWQQRSGLQRWHTCRSCFLT